MSKRSGLGKGLDALIPAGESHLPAESVTMVATQLIVPNPRQPRARFDPGELSELAASIREHGVIQPLILTHGPQPGGYMLIAGERRLMAARQAGLKVVPAIMREATEQQLVELALVENVQRADLGPLETAEAYRQLAEEFNLSHEAIAYRVGKNRVTITNTLRLLKLPTDVQAALAEEQISEGHARALLALPTPESQSAALASILKHDLNVRQTEELARKLSGQKPEKPPKAPPTPEIEAIEDRLRQYLGTRVSLNHRRKGGTVVIHYYSEEELNAVINLIVGKDE
jgi:ParB family transcriptional regulator, chromosome partitioning protein